MDVGEQQGAGLLDGHQAVASTLSLAVAPGKDERGAAIVISGEQAPWFFSGRL